MTKNYGRIFTLIFLLCVCYTIQNLFHFLWTTTTPPTSLSWEPTGLATSMPKTEAPMSTGEKVSNETPQRRPFQDQVLPTSPAKTEHQKTGNVSDFSEFPIEKRWKSLNDMKHSRPGVLHMFEPSVKKIRLIGERHSGTTFLTKYLKQCFPRYSVEDFFIRGKHWFQPTPQEIVEKVNQYGKEILEESSTTVRNNKLGLSELTWWDVAHHQPSPETAFQDTLVVALFRDPYQWLEAMRRKPWHWPNHLNVFPRNFTTLSTVHHDSQQKRLQDDGRVDGTDPHFNNRKRRRLQQQRISKQDKRNNQDPYSVPKPRAAGVKLDGPMSVKKSFIHYKELDWEEFVSRPMRLMNYIDQVETERTQLSLCQKGYTVGSISPCIRNETYVPNSVRHIPRPFLRFLPLAVNDVIYELKGNGTPFAHPLELRAAKMRNFLQLPIHWQMGGYVSLQYDQILVAADLHRFVEQLAKALRIPSACPEIPQFVKNPYKLPSDFSAWIDDHCKWELEALMGYATNQKL